MEDKKKDTGWTLCKDGLPKSDPDEPYVVAIARRWVWLGKDDDGKETVTTECEAETFLAYFVNGKWYDIESDPSDGDPAIDEYSTCGGQEVVYAWREQVPPPEVPEEIKRGDDIIQKLKEQKGS